ncbi:MAG: FUSC family protein [Candidatus Nanopelagicales bacterium]
MTSDQGTSAVAQLRQILSSSASSPVAWRNSVAVLLTMVLAAGFGLLLDATVGGHTVGASAIVGMFLGVVAVTGPFFMAVRLVLVIGLLTALAAGLAAFAANTAWLAVLGMVVVVFICTLWTALPLAGRLVGTFPAIVYLVLLAQNDKMTGGASAPRAMLAVGAPMLAALVVALVMSGRDPRKTSRMAVAGAWSTTVTWPQLGTTLTLLRLDFAPKTLIAMTQTAISAKIARNWVSGADPSDAYTAGVAAQQAIATTLQAGGPLTPRTVTPPVADTVTTLEAQGTATSDRRIAYGWAHWAHALNSAADYLAGTKTPNPEVVSRGSMLRALIRSVVHPDSAPFRYAVQRSLAMGIATWIMVSSSFTEFYWVLLAMYSVMQTNASATVGRAAQYAFGTWVGAVGAVLLGLVVPQPVMALVALVLLVAGFAYMVRNYFIFCVAIAASMVLLVGSPDGQYLQWAGLRALDVTIGALVAIIVSAFVLRVRPLPERHTGQARAALQSAVAQLKQSRPMDAGPTQLLADEQRFWRACANLDADRELMHDDDGVSDVLHQLIDANENVIALSTVVYSASTAPAPDSEGQRLLTQTLDDLDHTIERIHYAGT